MAAESKKLEIVPLTSTDPNLLFEQANECAKEGVRRSLVMAADYYYKAATHYAKNASAASFS